MAFVALTPTGTVAAPAALQSVLSMLAMRSPGERGGALVDTKHARTKTGARTPGRGGPSERALGKIFGPEPVAPAQVAGVPFVAPYQPGFLNDQAVASAPPGGGPGSGVPGGGGPGGGGPGGGGPGGGGSSGGGNPGGNNPGGGTPTGPPVAAVPEPATWLMMIVAFGWCGTMLRRRKRLEGSTAACVSAT